MFKRLWKKLKAPQVSPRPNFGVNKVGLDDAQRERMRMMQDADNYNLQMDVANQNLKVAHRTMAVALIAALIALGLGLYGIFSKPAAHITIEKIQITQQK
jgi:hypothetical protein